MENLLYFLFTQTILFVNQTSFTIKEKKNFKRDLLTEIVNNFLNFIKFFNYDINFKNSSIHGSENRPYKRTTSQLGSDVTKSPTLISNINIPSSLESNESVKCIESLLNNSF